MIRCSSRVKTSGAGGGWVMDRLFCNAGRDVFRELAKLRSGKPWVAFRGSFRIQSLEGGSRADCKPGSVSTSSARASRIRNDTKRHVTTEGDCVLNAYWYAQLTVYQLGAPYARERASLDLFRPSDQGPPLRVTTGFARLSTRVKGLSLLYDRFLIEEGVYEVHVCDDGASGHPLANAAQDRRQRQSLSYLRIQVHRDHSAKT